MLNTEQARKIWRDPANSRKPLILRRTGEDNFYIFSGAEEARNHATQIIPEGQEEFFKRATSPTRNLQR